MAQLNIQTCCCSVLSRVHLFATLQTVARRLPCLSEYSERIILYKDMEVLKIQKESPFNSDSFVRTASLQTRSLNVCMLTYNTETSPSSLVIVMVCVYSQGSKTGCFYCGMVLLCLAYQGHLHLWVSCLCVNCSSIAPPELCLGHWRCRLQSLKILFHPKEFHQKDITHRNKNRLPGKEYKP